MALPLGEEVLAGLGGFEDAAVVKVADDLALVATVDFITPVVDDPELFGEIAAANALSDVYAMGGDPWFALNILCLPCAFPAEVARGVVVGGLRKVKEARAFLVGGHSVDDEEPKYGLCVVGRVHPERVVRNSTLEEGALLYLTKPLGVGIVTTAIKAGLASEEAVEKAVESMRKLNKEASLKMLEVGAVAATDVTGFGFIGHALEMCSSGEFDIVVEVEKIPVIEEAFEYASMGLIPAGAYRNREYFSQKVVFERNVGDWEMVLFDPQTSGGLLVAVPEDRAGLYRYPCVGYVVKGSGRVVVR